MKLRDRNPGDSFFEQTFNLRPVRRQVFPSRKSFLRYRTIQEKHTQHMIADLE